MAAQTLLPHHHALFTWFDNYQVKEDSCEEGSSESSAEETAADNFLAKTVDNGAENIASERQLKIIKSLKAVKDSSSKFSGKDKKNYNKWLHDQNDILSWIRIAENFKPQ